MLETMVRELLQLNSDFSVKIVVVEETDAGNPIQGVKYVNHPLANRGIGYARNLALKAEYQKIIHHRTDNTEGTMVFADEFVMPG